MGFGTWQNRYHSASALVTATKDDEGEQNECSSLSNMDERTANVIYNRGADGANGWQ